jgi:membrane-bound lytic murein transglycosylase D
VCTIFFLSHRLIGGIADRSDVFPIPDNLKPNVKFWIKIYSKYTQSDFIIHDNENLDIIYEIFNINDRRLSERNKWKEIERLKDKYKAILRKLASQKDIIPETLNEEERFVYGLFGPNQSSEVFREAATNMRAQQGMSDRFKEGLIRAGRYDSTITEVFKRNNLPEELTKLPHVESSFNNKAYSKMGAAGLWQFTRGTGRLFLDINYTVDERFDPEKATEAAAKLLKNNYDILGTWPLALTAYNHGVNGMKKAINRLGTNDIGVIVEKYYSRQFQFASRNFYSEFLAAVHVAENYKTYFGDIELEKPPKYVSIELPYYTKFASLCQRLNCDIDEIQLLNPSLRRTVFDSDRRLPKGFVLKIPYRENFAPDQLYAQVNTSEKFDRQIESHWYQVEPGDNLASIANKFNTTIEKIAELNSDIQDVQKIYVGETLKVPSEKSELTVAQATDNTSKNDKIVNQTNTDIALLEKNNQPKDNTFAKKENYIAKTDDKLEKIAQQFNNPIKDLMRVNSAEVNDQIFVGQELKFWDDSNLMNQSMVSSKQEKDTTGATKLLADNQTSKSKNPEINNLKLPTNRSNEQITPRAEEVNPPIGIINTSYEQKGLINNKVIVQADETLGHFAEWLNLPTQQLRNLNGLVYGQEIQVGRQIKLAFTNASYEEFEQRRMEYHRGIEEDFFQSYKIDGVQIHKLKRGESIWYLCNDIYELPYWLLLKYNPNLNLNQLHSGDEIIIPIITPKTES